MVTFVQLTQIQKRSGEVSITLYRRENCRVVSGTNIGKLKERKWGENFAPHFIID